MKNIIWKAINGFILYLTALLFLTVAVTITIAFITHITIPLIRWVAGK